MFTYNEVKKELDAAKARIAELEAEIVELKARAKKSVKKEE